MSEKLFNSFYQAVLVKGYAWVAKCIDLETSYGARIYQWLYFWYKSTTDRETLQLLKKVALPGTTVIDVGANIGFFTLQACRLPQLQVIAFEPGPKNYQNLQKNITKAGYTQIATAFPIALSNHSGSGQLYLSNLAPTDHKLIGSDTDKNIDIDLLRLDDFYVQNTSLFERPVSLIKIDVQGAELWVMEGMSACLPLMRWPVLLVEYTPNSLRRAGVSGESFLSYFSERDYQFYDSRLQRCFTQEYLLNLDQAYIDIALIHRTSSLFGPNGALNL